MEDEAREDFVRWRTRRTRASGKVCDICNVNRTCRNDASNRRLVDTASLRVVGMLNCQVDGMSNCPVVDLFNCAIGQPCMSLHMRRRETAMTLAGSVLRVVSI
jgi:hypothetical protein